MLGERIKKIRKQCRLSQDELAEKTGISRSTVNNIERGNQRPSVDFVMELSRLTGESTDSILLIEELPPSEWEHLILSAIVKEGSREQRLILADKIAIELSQQKMEITRLGELLEKKEAELEILRDRLAAIGDALLGLSKTEK